MSTNPRKNFEPLNRNIIFFRNTRSSLLSICIILSSLSLIFTRFDGNNIYPKSEEKVLGKT